MSHNIAHFLVYNIHISFFYFVCSTKYHSKWKCCIFDNNEPMVGVSVSIKNLDKGVITDVNGNYTISGVPRESILVFSFVGMENLEVQVKGRAKINVEMVEKINILDDVVVIGYGTQIKRDISGAITSFSGKDVSKSSGGNINTSLQGKIPGMNITASSGEPSAGATITIRGAASLSGGSEPLYIVDGCHWF